MKIFYKKDFYGVLEEKNNLEKEYKEYKSRKESVINTQQEYENNSLDYENNSKYKKAVEQDFIYADKIEEQKRIIKNQEAKIKRKQINKTNNI